jgi:hypothetical protein
MNPPDARYHVWLYYFAWVMLALSVGLNLFAIGLDLWRYDLAKAAAQSVWLLVPGVGAWGLHTLRVLSVIAMQEGFTRHSTFVAMNEAMEKLNAATQDRDDGVTKH